MSSDLDKVVFVGRVGFKTSGSNAAEESLTEVKHVDLVGDLNEDILLPLVSPDQVADWKRDVCCMVGFVLFEDNVSPGLVEVSGCHFEVEGTLGKRNELGCLRFFHSWVFSGLRLLKEPEFMSIIGA